MVAWSSHFKYESGAIFWAIAPYNHPRLMGQEAGRVDNYSSGYKKIQFNKRKYLVHRVIWEMHNGPIPDGAEIDHINRVRTDNRIENLRVADDSTSSMNASKRKTNGCRGLTSKHKGVYRCGKNNQFRAVISHNKKRIHLGYFSEESCAALAYNEAAKKYHGEFAVLNEV